MNLSLSQGATMAKLRKMLRSIDSPEIISLMHLIETQNKMTIATWCVNYAKEHILLFIKRVFRKINAYFKRLMEH